MQYLKNGSEKESTISIVTAIEGVPMLGAASLQTDQKKLPEPRSSSLVKTVLLKQKVLDVEWGGGAGQPSKRQCWPAKENPSRCEPTHFHGSSCYQIEFLKVDQRQAQAPECPGPLITLNNRFVAGCTRQKRMEPPAAHTHTFIASLMLAPPGPMMAPCIPGGSGMVRTFGTWSGSWRLTPGIAARIWGGKGRPGCSVSRNQSLPSVEVGVAQHPPSKKMHLSKILPKNFSFFYLELAMLPKLRCLYLLESADSRNAHIIPTLKYGR